MTGLIYAVIVGLWAVVLVPMWLRKHDAGTEVRSVDRFSTAMRSLSRRDHGPTTGREVLMPASPRGAVVSGGRAPSTVARRAEAQRLAAVRRRRTALAALSGLLAVLVLAWVVGAAPVWMPLLAIVGAAGYLRYLRVEAIRARQLARRNRRRAAQRLGPVEPDRVVEEPASHEAPRARRPAEPLPDDAWEPSPVVLPTYVTAPPATSVPRKIDLTHSGAWSAARMLEHAAALPDPDEVFDARAEHEQLLDAAAPTDEELFDQQTLAEVEPTAGPAPDAVFDQEDEQFLGYFERRAVND